MNSLSKTIALCVSVLMVTLMVSCGQKGPYEAGSHLFGGILSPRSAKVMSIVDQNGVAVKGATIMVGKGSNDPFTNNILQAAEGTFEIPSSWTAALPVTIEAKGFIRTTFLNEKPVSGRVYQIRHVDGDGKIELKGTATQFGNLPKDGYVDFGLVVPLQDPTEVFNFGIETAISSEVDNISIFGKKVPLPSNLSLPTQKENYGIIPVTLDKPMYRSFFRLPGQYQMAAIRGKFPFKKVADALQGGQTMYTVLNDLTFTAGGLRNIDLPQGGMTQDIPVNELTMTQQFSSQAPTLADGFIMMSAVLAPVDGKLMAVEIKSHKSAEMRKLVGLKDAKDQSLLAIVMKEPARFVSELAKTPAQRTMALQKIDSNVAKPQFLDLIDVPVRSATKVTAVPPKDVSGVNKISTYAVLQDVVTITNDQGVYEATTRKWEVYSQEWVSDIELPDFGGNLGAANRWVVTYVGDTQPADTNQTGPATLKGSFATRNAVDF